MATVGTTTNCIGIVVLMLKVRLGEMNEASGLHYDEHMTTYSLNCTIVIQFVLAS